jgi:hypothetical protein
MWIENGVAGPLVSEFGVNLSEDSDESAHSPRIVDYSHPASNKRNVNFTKEEARSMMLQPGSRLRAVKLGDSAYTVRMNFSFV